MVPGPEAAEIVLAKLRGMIASGRQEKETILGTVAVAAHALTGASGAAIAMPRDGVVVCVGRSGEIAPDLGDRLSVDSGISGECLRTGRMMRCDDAARDFHVNAEICREMGIQSIAVIPLRERLDGSAYWKHFPASHTPSQMSICLFWDGWRGLLKLPG